MIQQENNMTQNEYNMTRHETTQVKHYPTRRKHDTEPAHHSIKTIFMYLYYRCILGTWYIKLKKLCLYFKTWKLKIAFSSKSQDRTGNSLFIEIVFIISYCIFIPTSYEKDFWLNIAGIMLRDIQLLQSYLDEVLSIRTLANRFFKFSP